MGHSPHLPSLAPTPADVLDAWPVDRPLVALWQAQPDGVVRLRAGEPGPAITDQLPPPSAPGRSWVGFVSYDYGRVIEPRARHLARPAHRGDASPAWPLMQWRPVTAWQEVSARTPAPASTPGAYALGPMRSATGPERYQGDVARVIEYLRAGDAYQVNLAHRLRGAFSGRARALARDLFVRARPRFGAYLEVEGPGPRRAIISLTPELFLHVDPRTRRIATRPMKGTRRGVTPADADALRDSRKDQAELNMIVDLMRNDLTRLCVLPSVRVTRPRDIEAHGPAGAAALLQATATVEGALRPGVGLGEILAATFPGGSVTGAPKVRAMQIIDELEPVPRGPYCGAIGVVDPLAGLELSIAIRTALIAGAPGPHALDDINAGTLDYSVGAGITVQSDPAREWQETLDKAGVLLG